MLNRQRFLHAAVFSGLIWLAVLLPTPASFRPVLEPYVLVGDITIIGFFLIGGSVFFERQERTLEAVLCTPLRFWEYLTVKLSVLTLISVSVAVIVVVSTSGIGAGLVLVVAGVFFGTVLMLLVGFISSLPFDSITDWFLATTIPLSVMSLPVLHLSGVWPSPVIYAIPTQGPLLMFGAAFGQIDLAPWQVIYAVTYPLLCIVGLAVLAQLAFDLLVARPSGVR